jgi:3-polyprenyl-4-hydroxybenzoate decarboxylase
VPERLAAHQGLTDWPLIVLVDDAAAATADLQEFLWTVFTRFEPAADIHAAGTNTRRFHVELAPPVVFDCRMKPWYTPVLEVDAATRKKVDAKLPDLLPRQWR